MKLKRKKKCISSFVSESQLVRLFQDLILGHLKLPKRKWVLSREVGVGRTVADLVAVSRSRHNIRVRPLSVKESVVISYLRDKKKTRIDILELKCGFKLGELRNGFIQKLECDNFVRRSEGGRVSLAIDIAADISILAFEAKLTRWKDALKQAIMYKAYANKSFVVLPRLSSESALKNIKAFEEAGVGLFVADEKAIECLLDAADSFGYDWKREYVGSRLVC